eukprot:5201004-Pyramimonas_sp.AAC.1
MPIDNHQANRYASRARSAKYYTSTSVLCSAVSILVECSPWKQPHVAAVSRRASTNIAAWWTDVCVSSRMALRQRSSGRILASSTRAELVLRGSGPTVRISGCWRGSDAWLDTQAVSIATWNYRKLGKLFCQEVVCDSSQNSRWGVGVALLQEAQPLTDPGASWHAEHSVCRRACVLYNTRWCNQRISSDRGDRWCAVIFR